MRLGRLVLILLLVLIIEMYLLIEIGSELGALPTILLVFITAAVGLWMMRLQGLLTMRRANRSLQMGQAPLREAAEGVVLLVGGGLLLFPGFFTDFIGLLCLLPPTRALLLRWLGRNVKVSPAGGPAGEEPGGTPRPRVIEGQWRRGE